MKLGVGCSGGLSLQFLLLPVPCSLLLLGLVTQVSLCKIKRSLALHRDTSADSLFEPSDVGWATEG